jgi:hypothetical protein
LLQGKILMMCIDRSESSHTLFQMGHERIPKPFLETWLRRTRKQLAGSGRLSELALILSREPVCDEEVLSQAQWRTRLQDILAGDAEPSLELLTKLDSLLAKRSDSATKTETGEFLF